MKIIIFKFALASVVVFAFSSCGDFFKEASQDEIRATTVEDLRAMMYSAAYPYTSVTPDSYLRLLTDETECKGLTDNNYSQLLKVGQPVFTFSKTMFDGIEPFVDSENTWANCYDRIKGCNAVLDYVGKMTGSENDKQAMRAQCYFLRGMYYLRLAMVYCLPYSNIQTTPDLDKALGVPLQLTSEVTDEKKKRTTLRETYAQIETDLLTSVDMLKEYYPNGPVPFRVSPVAAYALLSRLYFYMGEWQKCADYATLAIDNGPKLLNYNSVMNSYGYPTSKVYDVKTSPEVIFAYGTNSWQDNVFFINQPQQTDQPWGVSQALLAKFDQTNDIRYKSYYMSSPFNVIGKTSSTNTNTGDMGLRMGEVYMNRAEAYMRLYMAGDASMRAKAIDDLNTLRHSRYLAGSDQYRVDDSLNDEALLQFILDERQRELCWENGLRWADIKRLGLGVTHIYIDADGTRTTYTLPANSPLYALPIPYDAIDRNTNLEQNPR